MNSGVDNNNKKMPRSKNNRKFSTFLFICQNT